MRASGDLPRAEGVDPEGGHGGLRVALDEASLGGGGQGGGRGGGGAPGSCRRGPLHPGQVISRLGGSSSSHDLLTQDSATLARL